MARMDSNEVRVRIHERIRKKLSGTEARPRLCVFRSNKHIYAQIVDDAKGSTLAAACSLRRRSQKRHQERRQHCGGKGRRKNRRQARHRQGNQRGSFRSRRIYLSRQSQSLADAAREAGLKF